MNLADIARLRQVAVEAGIAPADAGFLLALADQLLPRSYARASRLAARDAALVAAAAPYSGLSLRAAASALQADLRAHQRRHRSHALLEHAGADERLAALHRALHLNGDRVIGKATIVRVIAAVAKSDVEMRQTEDHHPGHGTSTLPARKQPTRNRKGLRAGDAAGDTVGG